ncbi:MAG: twin-arginine translocation pathway signal protein [Nitrosomonas sp.]|nr:MAG: twin-arginine translocation pathway signal protein [Nitrosomonas sp.]
MEPEQQDYKAHHIELRARDIGKLRTFEVAQEPEFELLIDDKPIRYGQLPDGSYALYEYAYDWTDNLIDLAKKFIDYRDSADNTRREIKAGEEN